jgi:predicted nucleic acid-binding protein
MNVVDTSGWLAYFAGEANARELLKPIQAHEELIVPAICVYEISKVILRESDEHHLLQALAAIQKGRIVPLTSALSVAAAKVSLKHQLPMADSIIYATAQEFQGTVWTQNIEFEGLPMVHYLAKPK